MKSGILLLSICSFFLFAACEECVKCTITDQNGNIVDQQEHCTSDDDERTFVREELEDLGYDCVGS